jgi:hypothetical protein
MGHDAAQGNDDGRWRMANGNPGGAWIMIGTTGLTWGSFVLDRVWCQVRQAGLTRLAGLRDGLREDSPEWARVATGPHRKNSGGETDWAGFRGLSIQPKARLEIKKPLFISKSFYSLKTHLN